jgi:hypothetical protein
MQSINSKEAPPKGRGFMVQRLMRINPNIVLLKNNNRKASEIVPSCLQK